MRVRPGSCLVYDCARGKFRGGLCWQHATMRRRGKLSDAAIEGPPTVVLAPDSYTASGIRLMCADWDCERLAEPGSDYCRTHRQ